MPSVHNPRSPPKCRHEPLFTRPRPPHTFSQRRACSPPPSLRLGNAYPLDAALLENAGGRHLRLAWICSPADATQGWPGRYGVARVRVDTALRPQAPAVLLIPGPAGPARDPVVDLRVSAIPPHFVQPWASVEVVRGGGASGGIGKRLGGGNGQPGGGGSSGGGGGEPGERGVGLRLLVSG